MNVTGTIEAILNQKSGEIWSVSPDATVYEAIEKMAEKNVGALVVLEEIGRASCRERVSVLV